MPIVCSSRVIIYANPNIYYHPEPFAIRRVFSDNSMLSLLVKLFQVTILSVCVWNGRKWITSFSLLDFLMVGFTYTTIGCDSFWYKEILL